MHWHFSPTAVGPSDAPDHVSLAPAAVEAAAESVDADAPNELEVTGRVPPP